MIHFLINEDFLGEVKRGDKHKQTQVGSLNNEV